MTSRNDSISIFNCVSNSLKCLAVFTAACLLYECAANCVGWCVELRMRNRLTPTVIRFKLFTLQQREKRHQIIACSVSWALIFLIFSSFFIIHAKRLPRYAKSMRIFAVMRWSRRCYPSRGLHGQDEYVCSRLGYTCLHSRMGL